MDNNRNQYLKQLNKLSHKISKPSIRKPTSDPQNLPPPPPPPPQEQTQPNQQPQQQQQPPVYNINKNDFREVVQKLTGSPAHERFPTPPPIHHPKPQSSRLQRIRPPPLANFSNRPPHLLNNAVSIPPLPNTVNHSNSTYPNPSNFNPFVRFVSPLSPLPPFPTIHAAAESPVSAYMRCLQNSNTGLDSKQFSGFSPLISPKWNSLGTLQSHVMFPPPPPPPQQQGVPPSLPQFQLPSSPLPFGCLSPRSPYPLLSPGLLFSPSSGQLGFPPLPVSPRVPISSPRWKNV